MNHRAQAFTLVEVLIVAIIIAILVTLIVPTVQAGYSLAQEKTCNANLYVISKAIVAYCQNNKDQLPKNDDKDWSNTNVNPIDLLPGANSSRRWWCNKIYTLGDRNPNLYKCATDPLHFNPSGEVMSSYGFNSTLTDPEGSSGDGVTRLMQVETMGMTFLAGHCSPDDLGKAKAEPEIAEAMALDPAKWPVGHVRSYDREAAGPMGRGGFIMAGGDIKVFTYSQVKLLLKDKSDPLKLKLFHKN